jgi:hypothetical protein
MLIAVGAMSVVTLLIGYMTAAIRLALARRIQAMRLSRYLLVVSVACLGFTELFLSHTQQLTREQNCLHGNRQIIGVWLRTNTPPSAVVALEPIGYVGYFSERPILDLVGLVSPQVTAIYRQGGGWDKVIQQFHPDFLVLRQSEYDQLKSSLVNAYVSIRNFLPSSLPGCNDQDGERFVLLRLR